MLYGPDGKLARFSKADYDRDKKTIKKHAKPGCRRCFGRGWIGMNTRTGKLLVCLCVNREALVRELNKNNKREQRIIHAS